MRILLDTYIFLWWIKGDAKLRKPSRSKIQHANEVFVSSASIWELTIKIKLRKLEGDLQAIIDAISGGGLIELPITVSHAAAVASLPDIHRDPFDRILIAQAVSEPLTFLTADAGLRNYSELVEVVG